MMIDSSSRKNLELTETLRERKKRERFMGSRQNNDCDGRRKLRKWLEQPCWIGMKSTCA